MPKPLTSESLNKLLDAFSTDEDESAFAYTKLRDSLVRYFNLKGVSESDESADETLDRMAEKIKQGVKIDNLNGFAFGIAKYVFLEGIRSAEVHSRAVDSYHLKSGVPDNFGEKDHFELHRECFQGLYADEQELLLSYFQDLPADELFENRQKLADREKISLNALRNRVSRLRQHLEDCLNKIK
jgi:DNA-directed RNA polymerase specialized sigma24 family protein